ncbi:MAG: VacJ family lipoprotein [Candidatus Methylomirabilia bacterium]
MPASFESPAAPREHLELALKPRGGAEETTELDAAAEQDLPEYDPWEPFNQSVFGFNRGVDRHVLKPVATAYDAVLPDPVQRGLRNLFRNVGFVPRLVNNLLQLKVGGAARELARFVINSTLGLGGLFDVAKNGFGIEKSVEDTGQTLAVWGVGPGPYLILPLLPPLTVRDGVGAAVDVFLNPLTYFAPVEVPVGVGVGDAVNERSLNLELYEGVEESVLDLYTSVRNAYLQHRQHAIGQ